MKLLKVKKLISCDFHITSCLGKKSNKDNGKLPENMRWCFHQANYQLSLCNPAGLVQQYWLDTAQKVINHGNPEDQANNSKLLTDKNVHISMGFDSSYIFFPGCSHFAQYLYMFQQMSYDPDLTVVGAPHLVPVIREFTACCCDFDSCK